MIGGEEEKKREKEDAFLVDDDFYDDAYDVRSILPLFPRPAPHIILRFAIFRRICRLESCRIDIVNF